MKFVCVKCDEQMNLDRTLPPQDDAISAVFSCPNCGASFAMHTNSMETQLVRSMDVRVGGASGDRQPMGTIRGSLAGAKDIGSSRSQPEAGTVSRRSSGGCPFTGEVSEAFEASDQSRPVWTEAAEARLDRVPSFIRPMVKKGIEDVARKRGYSEVTEEIMQEVRSEMGM